MMITKLLSDKNLSKWKKWLRCFFHFAFLFPTFAGKKEVDMKYKLIICLFATMLVSCECPYQDADRINTSTKGDAFYAEKLLGTWQCYYPMIIGGVEFKEIKFMSNGKADITMAKRKADGC